jgi:hypothetical protein
MTTYFTGPSCPEQYGKRKNVLISELLEMVDIGDIILLSGGSFDSQAIEILTNTLWSHVLMVVRVQDRNDSSKSEPAAFESVYASHLETDVNGLPAKAGVRLVYLKDYLETYRGFIGAWRPLCAHDAEASMLLRKHMYKKMWGDDETGEKGCLKTYLGRPYESSWGEFINVWLGGLVGKTKPTPQKMFCSELVATCLVDAGLLKDDKISPNQYTPESFSSAAQLKLVSPDIMMGTNIQFGKELYFDLGVSYRPNSWWSLFMKNLCS